MRFCMMTTFYPPYSFGGDGIFVHRLANLLARSGHEVDVIHCIDSYLSLAKIPLPVEEKTEPGVTVHRLKSGAGILSPMATHVTGRPFFKASKIRAILSAKRFDVIHFHNISLLGGPKLLEYGEGIKIYTLHEYWLICPTHVLFKFNREVCVEKDCLRCQLHYGRPPQLWRYTGMLKKALRHVDVFIAPSHFARTQHLQEGLSMPIIRLPNFSTNGQQKPSSAFSKGRLPSRPFFLFAGRLEKLKGLQTVLPLFKTYDKADLVVAGDGNYASELKRLAAGCERIHFLGHLSQSQLQEVYPQAIALIVPSLWFENFPLVITEAYAAGIPVITREIGPLKELMEESQGGLCFRDEKELCDQMEKIQMDNTLREKLIRSGYQAFCRRYSEKAYLEHYMRLIEETARRKYGATVPDPKKEFSSDRQPIVFAK